MFGCQGRKLLPRERKLFAECDPFGFILFDRNISSPGQVRALVGELKESVRRKNVPILIDQEGGRVVRLRPPHWPVVPSAKDLISREGGDVERMSRAVFVSSRLVAQELANLQITINCMPVLDLEIDSGHEIIGDRAYAGEPEIVAKCGRSACQGSLDGGVLPVIKHLPGHGRATSDSHVSLPFVRNRLAELVRTDFAPFRALCDMPIGMTAHVVFSDIDPNRPATTSPVVISEIIRGYIGFDGLLLTDDICMSALEGSLSERAKASLLAGCDVVLHCSGVFSEMCELVRNITAMSNASWDRAERAAAFSAK